MEEVSERTAFSKCTHLTLIHGPRRTGGALSKYFSGRAEGFFVDSVSGGRSGPCGSAMPRRRRPAPSESCGRSDPEMRSLWSKGLPGYCVAARDAWTTVGPADVRCRGRTLSWCDRISPVRGCFGVTASSLFDSCHRSTINPFPIPISVRPTSGWCLLVDVRFISP